MAVLNARVAYFGGVGASAPGGVGPGIVDAFLRKGWRVFAGYSADAEGEMAVLFRRYGESLSAVRCDAASDAETAAAASFAAERTGAIDLVGFCGDRFSAGPAPALSGGQDYGDILSVYDANALGLLRTVRTFLPLLGAGSMKRLCFVTDADALVNGSTAVSAYGRNLSKAAADMAAAILFNRLRPEGYTFRTFCRDSAAPAASVAAYDYFTRGRSFEPENPRHSDENRFTARDGFGRERPW
jgi:NAD(P)-dependent dehydrogenase (short-subunit alcohol dehydrogenase family)